MSYTPPRLTSKSAPRVIMFTGFLVLALTCHKHNQPPDPPEILAGPSAVLQFKPCWFAARATDPDGDSVSLQFAWGDGDTTDWLGPVASGDSIGAEHVYAEVDTHLLRVCACDPAGALSAWSPPTAVHVEVRAESLPVAVSGPTGPSTAAILDECSFSCLVVDPDSASVKVRFDWGDGDTSRWSDWASSPASFLVTHQYCRAQTYNVRVAAQSWIGRESGWTPGWPIAVQTTSEVGKPKWAYDLKWSFRSSPAIGADGTVYVGGNSLYALNSDGSLEWLGPPSGSDPADPVLAPDGTVCWSNYGGPLRAAWSDGTLKWSRLADGDRFSGTCALAEDGTIYASSEGGTLFAVNPDSTTRWRCRMGYYPTTTPAIGADGTVYVGCDDCRLHALGADGTPKWTFQTRDEIRASPVIDGDGTIYVTSFDSCLYAVRPDSTEKWHFKAGWRITAPPAIGPDGTVYVGNSGGEFYAIDSTGKMEWSYAAGAPVVSSPAVAADGTIYFGSTNGLHAINPDGSSRWFWPASEIDSHPVIGADGTVYITANMQLLYAINGTAPLADSPWPMFGHDPQHTGRAGARRTFPLSEAATGK